MAWFKLAQARVTLITKRANINRTKTVKTYLGLILCTGIVYCAQEVSGSLPCPPPDQPKDPLDSSLHLHLHGELVITDLKPDHCFSLIQKIRSFSDLSMAVVYHQF